MGKNLIDRNKAFDMYYSIGTSRSIFILHENILKKYPKRAPAYDTLKKWSVEGDWKERVVVLDMEINATVHENMVKDWAEVKSYFLETLVEQVKLGRDSGVMPKNTGDISIAIKEARSIMGEGDKHDITITRIEYVPYKKPEEKTE